MRLRLTRNEVARLRDEGLVECAIRFPASRTLCYSVASSPDAAVISVSYGGDSIRVELPGTLVSAWASDSSEITMEGSDSGVHILVEKDFHCLHQSVDRDPEAFPNPLA